MRVVTVELVASRLFTAAAPTIWLQTPRGRQFYRRVSDSNINSLYFFLHP
jgi:hypothetical protein